MNKRIRELAEQAKLDLDQDIKDGKKDWKNSPQSYDEMITEKFAELIVRECMSLCTDVEEDVELADYVGGFRDGALMCREDIKKHFGVEE